MVAPASVADATKTLAVEGVALSVINGELDGSVGCVALSPAARKISEGDGGIGNTAGVSSYCAVSAGFSGEVAAPMAMVVAAPPGVCRGSGAGNEIRPSEWLAVIDDGDPTAVSLPPPVRGFGEDGSVGDESEGLRATAASTRRANGDLGIGRVGELIATGDDSQFHELDTAGDATAPVLTAGWVIAIDASGTLIVCWATSPSDVGSLFWPFLLLVSETGAPVVLVWRRCFSCGGVDVESKIATKMQHRQSTVVQYYVLVQSTNARHKRIYKTKRRTVFK